ncbi:Ubiquitin modifier-activating enzyme 6, partial [Fasciolopsis buskii]
AVTAGLNSRTCLFVESSSLLIISQVSADRLNITVYGDQRHQLESGNVVRFTEIGGMTELNDREFAVNVISPSEFFINVATNSLSPYTGGGVGKQVIVSQVQSYQSMVKQLREPTIVTTDLSRPDDGQMLHLTFLALAKFRQDRGRYPEPWYVSFILSGILLGKIRCSFPFTRFSTRISIFPSFLLYFGS